MSICIQSFVFTEIFLEQQCTKNSDGTRNLILRGNDLSKKIGERINNGHIVTIVFYLRNHPDIVALDFPYNEISDCGIWTLTKFLKERPLIRYLNLIGNDIGPKGMEYLADLGDVAPFYTLRLSGNKIGVEGGKSLSKLLRRKTPLTFLDLSDTHQTTSSLSYILEALMGPRGGNKNLQYIDLGRPLLKPFHTFDDAHLAEFISQVLRENKHLKEIHLQQYQFDFRDAEILSGGLMYNQNLICLDLNNNNIGDDGVEYLCQCLKILPTLECLMIGANNFGNLGALSLSYSLPFSKIKLLDITNNRIRDEGMINIFYTIEKNIRLSALFLHGNKITHTSLQVLHRIFCSHLLDPNHTDVKLYYTDGKWKASWDPQANRFTHRFYCVSDYGHPSLLKPLHIFRQPVQPQNLKYRYHSDDESAGRPESDWTYDFGESKYIDPI